MTEPVVVLWGRCRTGNAQDHAGHRFVRGRVSGEALRGWKSDPCLGECQLSGNVFVPRVRSVTVRPGESPQTSRSCLGHFRPGPTTRPGAVLG